MVCGDTNLSIALASVCTGPRREVKLCAIIILIPVYYYIAVTIHALYLTNKWLTMSTIETNNTSGYFFLAVNCVTSFLYTGVALFPKLLLI